MEAIKQARKLKARRYRNRKLGDFLKELELTEGRATGIPTIQDELHKNGSPDAMIETDEDRSYFLIEIPCHDGFEQEDDELDEAQNEPNVPQNEPKMSLNEPKMSLKEPKNGPNVPNNDPNVPKNDPNVPKNVPNVPKNEPNVPKNDPNVPKNEPNVPNDVPKNESKITDRHKYILEKLRNEGTISSSAIAEDLSVSGKTIKRDMIQLMELGVIRHIGPKNGGRWEIITNDIH
jgi:predicted HTH transcriptional regulator